MKFRKLLLASLITLSGCLSLVAQNLIHVYGTVVNANGGGQEDVTINVSAFFADSSFFQQSLLTDANGDYDVNIPQPDPNILGFIQVDMVDCNNTIQTLFFTTAQGALEFEGNFTYCSNNQDSCLVFIYEESNPGALNHLVAWTPPSQNASYLWNTGETTQAIFPVQSGTYCVTATLSPLACTVVDCYEFIADTFNYCFAYIISTPNGDSTWNLEVFPSGTAPFTYSWDNGFSGPVLQGVGPGTYCVTVSDATGCSYTTCIIVENNNFCEAYISHDPATGGLTAYGFGLPPVSYLWNTGQTTQTIYPGLEGLYCVTVTDANGCEAATCYQFWFPFDSCFVWVNAYLQDSNTLALEAWYSGFGVTYEYLWSTGENTQIIYPQDPFQSYCVTVTDETGCSATGCYEPSNWCYAWVDLNYTDTTTAVLTANNDPIFNWPGSPPTTYIWSNGATTQTITVHESGEYCVTVVSGNQCITEACTYVDFENLSTDCSAWVYQFPDSTNSTWFAAVYAWGWGTFSYEWSTGDTTDIIQLDPNEFACVTVTSSLGCETVACIDTFFNPCTPYISWYQDTDTTAVLTAGGWGDPANSTYLWSNGATTSTISVFQEGTYCVTVTGGGCTGSTCIEVIFGNNKCYTYIEVTDTLAATVLTAIPFGIPPFTYLWDDGSTSQAILVDFGVLDHCVTVTDATGCMATACTFAFDTCYAFITLEYLPDPTLYVNANYPIVFTEWNTGNPQDSSQWLTITEPGTYCATYTSLFGCTGTTCITIDSLYPWQGGNVISGFVFGDTLLSIAGYVHAYSVESNTGVFEEVGQGRIDPTGFYLIENLDPGVYILKADFDAGSDAEATFIPTYHYSHTGWEHADRHVLPNWLPFTTDIKLVRQGNVNGGGVIGGVVTDPNNILAGQDADPRNQTGVANVVVLLFDESGTPIDYVRSLEDGTFRFVNLPLGTYRLQFDIPGIQSPEVWVTLTQDAPEKLQVTLIAENGSVAVDDPVSQDIQLYPNPAKEEVSMVVPGDDMPYDISVIDMQGRLIYAGSARNHNGILSLDVSKYSNGLYHINLLKENRLYHGRFIKQE